MVAMSPVEASPSNFCMGVMRRGRWLLGMSSQKSSPSISTFWPCSAVLCISTSVRRSAWANTV
jgi:hypothetical protein